MQRLKLKDIVEVISGNHTGSQGKILRFNKERTRAYIEKVAMVKKHTKPSQKNPAGGIVEIESSVHVSNLMLVDPSNKKAGKIKINIAKDGKKTRVFKETGTALA